MTTIWLKTSSEAEAVYLLWIEQGNRATWFNVNKAIFITTYRDLLHRSLQMRRPPCILFTSWDLSKGIQSTVRPTPIHIWSAECLLGFTAYKGNPLWLSQKKVADANIFWDECHSEWQGNAHLQDVHRKNLQGRMELVRDRNEKGEV